MGGSRERTSNKTDHTNSSLYLLVVRVVPDRGQAKPWVMRGAVHQVRHYQVKQRTPLVCQSSGHAKYILHSAWFDRSCTCTSLLY